MSSWPPPYSSETYEQALRAYAASTRDALAWLARPEFDDRLPEKFRAWSDVRRANRGRRARGKKIGAPLYGQMDCGVDGYPNFEAQSYAGMIYADMRDHRVVAMSRRLELAADSGPEVLHRIECALAELTVRNHPPKAKQSR